MQEYREKYGDPDVIKIRQIFNDSLQARDWEHKVLRRINAVQDERWLNQTTGKSVDPIIVSRTQRKRIQDGTHPFANSQFSKDVQRKRIQDGTHHFLGGAIQREMVKNGTHHLLGENNPCHEMVKNGTHHFLGGAIQRERVKNGTHNFLGGAIQHRMIADGTHPFLTKVLCQYCNKVFDKGNFAKHHRRKM